MKKNIYLLLVGIIALTFSVSAKPASTFAKHNYEFQVTPSADYHLWQNGDLLVDEPYKTTYPFIGFGFGVNYIFRPVEVVGISSGFNIKMQGGFTRVRAYPLAQSSYISFKGNHHMGYITIPVYVHLYKEMSNSTFEFAIGPDFNIPLFTRSAGASYISTGEKISSSKDSEKLTTDQMKTGAAFGLSIFLGGEIHLFDNGNLFIGPQIQFLNLVAFNEDVRESGKRNGKFYDASLGLKLGFRFHK